MCDDVTRELAYEMGYAWALTAAAERVDEIDALWQPIQRPTYEQVIARRVATMERGALLNATDRQGRRWNTWAGQYPGAPVDYETGVPLGRWLGDVERVRRKVEALRREAGVAA